MAVHRTRWLDVDDDRVGSILQVIQQLPSKGYSLKMLVNDMRSDIQQALDRGYSYPELATILTKQGIKIAPRTLREYLKQGKPKAKPKPPPGTTPPKQRQSTAPIVAPPTSCTLTPGRSETIGDFVEMADDL
jgi:hypothetical protein